jgi:hypothetical protein
MTTPKQAFEWVKTGHWSFAEFNKWFNDSNETAETETLDSIRYKYLTANGNIGERLRTSYDSWDGCDGKHGFDRIIDNSIKDTL